MRRQIKSENSEIIKQKLTYKSDNSANNKKIANILYSEQKGFCSYTEEYMSRTDAEDIEHFNPNLKDAVEDNYNNWFLVKHLWNKEKSEKWDKFQPCIHPAHESFENRIWYEDGTYRSKNEDEEAKNTIELLNLNDYVLSENRKKYIKRRKNYLELYPSSKEDYFSELIQDLTNVKYLRAIKTEFEVDIWEMLPTPEIESKKEREV